MRCVNEAYLEAPPASTPGTNMPRYEANALGVNRQYCDVETSQEPVRYGAKTAAKDLIMLLGNDIKAGSNDLDGQTPSSCAAEYGHEAVVELPMA